MLLPSEMSKVKILIHKGDSEKLIENLHKSGLMEIDRTSEKEVKESTMHPDVGICASYVLRLSRIIEILKNYEKKKKGIVLKKVEKKRVKEKSLDEKIKEADDILNEIEKFVIDKEKEINELEERKEKLEEELVKLEYLAKFGDFDTSWLGKTKYLIVKFGISNNIESLKEMEGIFVRYRSIGKKKERRWAVIIFAHSSMEKDLQKIRNFEEISIERKGLVGELLKEVREEIRRVEEDRKKIRKEMAKIYGKRKLDLLAIREEMQIEKEKKGVQQNFGETQYTFLIEGWCLTRDEEKLRKLVERVTEGNSFISIEKASRNPDQPPIHLENPKWAKPFETFLELFSLPKYNEVNPTVFLGISFIIFFSVMLGDAGYGLVIFILSLIARMKFKESDFIRNWSFLGIWLGIGNIVTGFLFNSFFGDFIPRFLYGDAGKMIYNANLFGINLPIDAIHKPVLILAIALVLGLIHMNVGIVLGIYQNIARRHYRSIVMEQVPWFLMQFGGGLLIADALLGLCKLDATFKLFLMALTVIGLILLFKENGPLGFFEITGFMGDWLSYARLLALGLATAGMALAFNVVAELLPSIIPYVGIVLLPIILIFAHLANLLLQSLGAAIHALRLQYVEFFNRFYGGGGKKFTPFKIRRKYTEVIK